MQEDKLKKFREKLTEEGFKVTPQRIEVVNALVKLDHPTAKEIKQHIEDRYPMISPSTIYGTLDLLENMGELIPIQEGSETKYDLSPEVHPHFICEEDGEVRDIDDPEIESKLRELLKDCPFEADRIELNFYGKCNVE
ncbi:MAG: transcriptional repressor [Candidatus Bipolaricaulota bacterium]|nr:transcriptional repressor [Candidatus Bipolaricaulota bacterium]MBS3792339.1 transcriptional repressor [Candidatus Bipolaricaulota bacterium]